MEKELKKLYIVLFLLGLSITIYFILMQTIFKEKISDYDPLNVKILNAPLLGKNCCSWWPISHFISFSIFGYIWPQYWHHLFILGVVWELIEWLFNYLSTPKGEELKFKNTRMSDGSVEYEQWWSSSSKDILFNSAGILLGVIVNIIVKKYIKIK